METIETVESTTCPEVDPSPSQLNFEFDSDPDDSSESEDSSDVPDEEEDEDFQRSNFLTSSVDDRIRVLTVVDRDNNNQQYEWSYELRPALGSTILHYRAVGQNGYPGQYEEFIHPFGTRLDVVIQSYHSKPVIFSDDRYTSMWFRIASGAAFVPQEEDPEENETEEEPEEEEDETEEEEDPEDEDESPSVHSNLFTKTQFALLTIGYLMMMGSATMLCHLSDC